MIKKLKPCKNCKKDSYIWKAGLCKPCSLLFFPTKKIKYKSAKQKIKDKENSIKRNNMNNLFIELFDEHKELDDFGYFVKCFESDKKLYEKYYKYNTSIFHHVLEKSIYPEFCLEKWNIIFLDPDIHSMVHTNIQKTPKVLEKRKKLIDENIRIN